MGRGLAAEGRGQHPSWEEIRARLLPTARRYCRDPRDAEDVLQEALARAWRYRDKLRESDLLWPWLRAIVRNEALRANGHQQLEHLGEADYAERQGQDDDRLGAVPMRVDIQTALRRLTPEQRLLLALRYERDLTQGGIARVLRMPEGTVKVQLHRARRRLAKELGADGFLD